jgi:hypothetical protein
MLKENSKDKYLLVHRYSTRQYDLVKMMLFLAKFLSNRFCRYSREIMEEAKYESLRPNRFFIHNSGDPIYQRCFFRSLLFL